ncbi:hypothetical protein ACL1IL_01245 [Corynebacterium striatum]
MTDYAPTLTHERGEYNVAIRPDHYPVFSTRIKDVATEAWTNLIERFEVLDIETEIAVRVFPESTGIQVLRFETMSEALTFIEDDFAETFITVLED